jgi:hypothetical protein
MSDTHEANSTPFAAKVTAMAAMREVNRSTRLL